MPTENTWIFVEFYLRLARVKWDPRHHVGILGNEEFMSGLPHLLGSEGQGGGHGGPPLCHAGRGGGRGGARV
jgi:hypothetical protein